MTSKQVKKAYQQANRQPRVSRAEQRRRDAEELARQKKEYERERTAARARATREKKIAKENAEKEARRKMGLPEPSRFVRASQPTISKFVRSGNNGKRSWQEMKVDCVAEDSDETLTDAGAGENEAQPRAKRVAADDDSEDEFGEFPSLSQSDLLKRIDSSMLSMQEHGSGPGSPAVVAKQPTEPLCREPSQELPARKSSEDEYPLDDSQTFAKMANTQLLSEAAEAAHRSDSVELPTLPIPEQTTRKPTPPRKPSQPAVKPMVRNESHTIYRKSPVVSRPALQEVSVNMPPPPFRFKEKRAISFAPTPQKPRVPPQNIAAANRRPLPNIAPSSTQSFLENHLDDFFPSPTQEMRELLSDADSLPSSTQIARELSLEQPEAIIDNLPPNRPLERGLSLTKPTKDDHFDDLICTQDLILSSQELLEITTPSRALAQPVIKPEVAKQKPVPRTKPRFFEEKEDDILHAVLHESKKAATLPKASARDRRRTFFEEKEDDLLAAAIHESKIMAEKMEVVRVPLKESDGNERKERTLKRVLSSATTDYGEDEFSGGEWESLGL
jgi:hypothetical protein